MISCDFQTIKTLTEMNRKSLGADIYSPIRFDVSMNDSITADGSVSDFYGGSFGAGVYKDSQRLLEPIQDEDGCRMHNAEQFGMFKASDKKKSRSNCDLFTKSSPNLHINRCKDFTPATSPGEVFLASSGNLFAQPNSPIMRQASPLTSKKPAGETQERHVTKRSSKLRVVSDKFITVRGDSWNSRLSPEPPALAKSSLSKSIEDITSKLSDDRVDGCCQTDLTLADLQILMNKIDLHSSERVGGSVKVPSDPCMAGLVRNPTPFQANPLENLKDTVDEEFRRIRLMLYLQQSTLSKIMYKNLEETENTNSNLKIVAEGLNSIITFLKNDQLRNTSLSRHFNS